MPRPGTPEGKSSGNGLGGGAEGGPPRNRTSDPKVLRFQKAHSASPADGENQGQERVETSRPHTASLRESPDWAPSLLVPRVPPG